jgi:hypothetical protein
MATPELRAYHDDKVLQERARVLLRIANGTKASSPAIISARRQNPSFKGLPDNSTGSRNQPFFAAKDESNVRLEDKISLRGGVLKSDKYAKMILKRRARNVVENQERADGIPVADLPIPELTPEESRSLELNTLLTSIENAIETGAVSTLTLAELKNIPRLIISLVLSDSITPARVVELIQYLNDLIESVSQLADPALRSGEDQEDELGARSGREQKTAQTVATFLTNLRSFLKDILKVIGFDQKTRVASVKALAREYFKLGAVEAMSFLPSFPDQQMPAAFAARAPGERRSRRETALPKAPGEQAFLPSPAVRRKRIPAPPAPVATLPLQGNVLTEPQPPLRNVRDEREGIVNALFASNDTAALRDLMAEHLPRLRAERYFQSRTTLRNALMKNWVNK